MRNFSKFVFSLNFLYIVLIAAETAAIIFLCLYIPAFMPAAFALAAIYLISATACLFVAAGKSGGELKTNWLVLIVLLPVAGAVIYFIAHAKIRNKTRTFTINKSEVLPQISFDELTYIGEGETFFNLMFDKISAAKRTVFIEFFIIGKGEIFNRFFNAVSIAAKNGAEIKIMTDGIGSAFKCSKKDLKKLKNAGAEIKVFHKLSPLSPSLLNLRDHRKIAVIDGETAFTGGFNLSDEYANIKSPYGFWKDSGAMICGKAAKAFEGMFKAVWHGEYNLSMPELKEQTCGITPFCDNPPALSKVGENTFTSAIFGAKSKIYILTPYFCAGEKVEAALEYAAKRGADVKIIIPHIPDKKYAFELSKARAQKLQKSGVKIYEFTPGFMHAKCVICDGVAFVGSYNLDFRSFNLNYECGFFTKHKPFVSDAEKDFLSCLALSKKLSAAPPNICVRILRFILNFLAPLM